MTLTRRLTITLPIAPTTPSTPPITQPPATRRAFPVPRSPYPWVWRCHKCHTVFRFSAALNRCLQCSHRFCAKCVSEFDYSGWEHWKSYWRPGCGPSHVRMGGDGGVDVWEDVYRGEIESEQEMLWDGFEIVTRVVRKELGINMDIDKGEEEIATPPTSPSSEGSDEVGDLWEMTQNHLQRTQTTNTNPPQEPRCTLSNGVECEPMSLPPVPNSTPESGYRSVQGARKALYPVGENNDYYGTREERETMKDFLGRFNPDEIRRTYICRGVGETAECGGSGEGDGDGPLWSPGLMSPLEFF